jgi:hypothetical protein
MLQPRECLKSRPILSGLHSFCALKRTCNDICIIKYKFKANRHQSECVRVGSESPLSCFSHESASNQDPSWAPNIRCALWSELAMTFVLKKTSFKIKATSLSWLESGQNRLCHASATRVLPIKTTLERLTFLVRYEANLQWQSDSKRQVLG